MNTRNLTQEERYELVLECRRNEYSKDKKITKDQITSAGGLFTGAMREKQKVEERMAEEVFGL